MQKHDWGILPIEDEVTKYAYPSKISSYILNDCKIFVSGEIIQIYQDL